MYQVPTLCHICSRHWGLPWSTCIHQIVKMEVWDHQVLWVRGMEKFTSIAGGDINWQSFVQSSLFMHRVCICGFTYSLNLFAASKSALTVLLQSCVDVHRTGNCELSEAHVPSWHWTGSHSASSFQLLSLSTTVLFTIYLMPCVSHVCAFFGWFCGLTWPLKIVLKSRPLFLSANRLWWVLWGKYVC